MEKEIIKIIKDLKNIKGLDNFCLINKSDKKKIIELEETNNIGIRECLEKRFTLLLTHDSGFRDPAEKIVKENNKKIIFPAVSFPEVKANNVVSSSPSLKVHKFLVNRFNLKLREEDATLLIGLDI